MAFTKKDHFGEVCTDHTNSPGLTKEQAEAFDLPPNLLAEGRKMHAPALGCPHCGSVVILNPMRTRPRNSCMKCNRYICDGCAAVMTEPDYVHRTIEQIAEMVHSGKWRLTGSMSRPILVPVTENPNG